MVRLGHWMLVWQEWVSGWVGGESRLGAVLSMGSRRVLGEEVSEDLGQLVEVLGVWGGCGSRGSRGRLRSLCSLME